MLSECIKLVLKQLSLFILYLYVYFNPLIMTIIIIMFIIKSRAKFDDRYLYECDWNKNNNGDDDGIL